MYGYSRKNWLFKGCRYVGCRSLFSLSLSLSLSLPFLLSFLASSSFSKAVDMSAVGLFSLSLSLSPSLPLSSLSLSLPSLFSSSFFSKAVDMWAVGLFFSPSLSPSLPPPLFLSLPSLPPSLPPSLLLLILFFFLIILGVIIYIMLCGFPPFMGQDTNETFKKIKALSFSFPSPWWDEVSNSAKDLICHCLDPGL